MYKYLHSLLDSEHAQPPPGEEPNEETQNILELSRFEEGEPLGMDGTVTLASIGHVEEFGTW